MRGLSAAELLSVWETGTTQSPAERALGLLAAALPDIPLESLANLSIGERDALLLTLRSRVFGSRLLGLQECPGCRNYIEVNLDTSTILSVNSSGPVEGCSVIREGFEVQLRPPTSSDLLAVRESAHEKEFHRVMLERCVEARDLQGQVVGIAELSPTLIGFLAEEFERIDPLGNIQMALRCPSCKREWQALFDIVSFFWMEIAVWAVRMFREIHQLASAYGWSETEILGMACSRRQVYLQLIGA
jgi:hypothetical protein